MSLFPDTELRKTLLAKQDDIIGAFRPDSGVNSSISLADTFELGENLRGKLKSRPFEIDQNPNNPNNLYMSYPVARNPDENTGDTLLIKCLEYVPAGENMGASLDMKNFFLEDPNPNSTTFGQRFVPNASDYEKGGALEGKTPSLSLGFTSGNQRHLEKQTIKYYIELPAPQEVNDNNSITWGDNTINALEMAALNVATNAMRTSGVGRAGVQAARSAVTLMQTGIDLTGSGGVSSEINANIRAAISGAAVGALGSNVTPQSVIARSTGQILNSNTELLFQGVNLRTFPFSCTFTPRSPDEAKVVKSIIRSLKQSMAAKAGEFNGSSATGIFLKSPDVFSLRYLHNGKDHPFLNSFKICALTGLSVNYTNAGTYASYSDGTPVAIRLNMTFKEINPIYNEDYGTSEAGSGVGY